MYRPGILSGAAPPQAQLLNERVGVDPAFVFAVCLVVETAVQAVRLTKRHMDVRHGLSRPRLRQQRLQRRLKILFLHARTAKAGMYGDLAFKRVRQRIDPLPSEVMFEPLSRDAWLPYPLLLGRKAFFQSDFSHDPSGFPSKVH